MLKSGELPIVTVEMRIQPLVRYMVQAMMMSEQEVNESISKAAEDAIKNFNFRSVIDDAVKAEFTGLLRKEVEDMVRRMFWNPDIKVAMKKRLSETLVVPEAE